MTTLRHGDCRDIMATMDASSVDAIVTDPPYGLAFMGKDWDHGVPGVEFWTEALRVAKPGAHLLAFGGTRTFHRLACAIEDAGWEIRDTIMWVYGSGFPKSHDVSKAIDKAAGAEREVVGQRDTKTGSNKETNWKCSSPRIMDVTAPATDAARQWSGWGTALKPAWEPIIVARKPLCGTVAENVLRHGTGGINIDGCRAGARWPANVAHDGIMHEHGRYFYCAKTSKADRNDGCEGIAEVVMDIGDERPSGGSWERRGRGVTTRSNHHPTVKPTELMRYLVRLVTPPGGVVLDPFCGSGSTGRGAILEGMSFIGIDLDEDYLEIARRRINACLTPMDALL